MNEIIEAAKIAQAHDSNELSKRLSNRFGTGRRKCVRRAEAEAYNSKSVAESPKFILDDSTSAVDTNTDANIRKALKEKQRT